ncbi:MAG: GFA family protein [Chthoniobacterales bacterium]
MNVQIEGGCLCGGVRYRLRELPKQLSDCHCLDCRRASAAPFVTWGAFRREKIEVLSGEVGKVSHADRLRSFARCCGTPLFFEDDAETEWVDVTISSLDDPDAFSPEVAIWTEDRLPWVPLDPARPAYQRERGSQKA